jgi:nucleotide-binding universal stress UspA family protein
LYKKVLLAYDGSIEGRLALREGAKLAQFCGAEVFLLAVVETASSVATLEGGVVISMDEQIATYKAILAEGVALRANDHETSESEEFSLGA